MKFYHLQIKSKYRQKDADKKPPMMMRQGHHEGLKVINRTAVLKRKESNNGPQ
jgi:hypothetical protein